MVQEENGNDIVLELRHEEKEGLLDTKKDCKEELILEENFQESLQMKAILELFPIVIFNWKNEENWPVEYVSKNVAKLTGYRGEEFKQGVIHYSDIIHPEDLKNVTDEVKNNSENDGVSEFEHKPYRILTKTGETKWVQDCTSIQRNTEGKITNYRGIVQDITKITELRDKLREKERQYRLLTETMPVAVYSLDDETPHQINFITDIISAISGYDTEEFVKTSLLQDIIFEDDKKRINQARFESITKKQTFCEEYRIITKQQKTVWINDRFNPVLDEDGNLVQLNGFLEDISLRKEYEQNLQEKIAQLQRYKKVTVGREIKMIELKKQIARLEKELRTLSAEQHSLTNSEVP